MNTQIPLTPLQSEPVRATWQPVQALRATWAATVVTGSALAPLGAEAAAYIKFDGIDGTVVEAPVVIPLEQFSWLQVSAGGRFLPRADRPMVSISDDAAAITFNRAQTVSFGFTDGNMSEPPYFQIEMKDVYVTSYDISSKGGAPRKLVFDGYSAASVFWLPRPTANNPVPTALTAHWDTASGGFSGALESLGGFDAIGAMTLPDGTISFTSAVPEPGSWGLGLAGLSAVAAVVRRRRASATAH